VFLQGRTSAGQWGYGSLSLNAQTNAFGLGLGTAGANLPTGQTGTTNLGMWVNTANDLFSGRDMTVGRNLIIPNLASSPAKMLIVGSGGNVTATTIPTIPTQYTDEMAQDAVGAMVSNEFTYTDATPLLAINAVSASKITESSSKRFVTDAEKATWNGKQNQLNGTGFVKANGTTITYD